MVTKNQITNMFYEARAELVNLGYDELLDNFYDITFSNRMTKTLGYCKCIRHKEYQITINSNYMNICDCTALKNTIVHELIHSIQGCMNHKGKWKMIANQVNKVYGYHISRCSYYEDYHQFRQSKKNYKYKVICNYCKKEWKYQKKGRIVNSILKNPNSCTCNYCNRKSFSIITL